MMGESDRRPPLTLLFAAASGGVLVGLVEAAWLAVDGKPITASAVAGLILRMGLLSTVLCVLSAMTAVAGNLRGRKAGTLFATGLALLVLGSGGILVARGHVSSDSSTEVSLFFLIAGVLAPLVCLRAVGLLEKLGDGNRIWMAALVVAPLLVIWNPGHLRGTYRPLDLLMEGAALLVASMMFHSLPLTIRVRWWGTSAMVVVLGVLTVTGPHGGLDPLLDASPRLRFLERAIWIPTRIGEKSRDIGEIRIDTATLFDPPEDPAWTRARYGAMRMGKGPLSVLWITIDALRPELTGLRGGKDTPHLDEFAERSLGFTHAVAQGPGTFVSTESMFRSRMPGMRYPPGLDAASPELASRDFPTIAAMLSEAGLQSLLVSGCTSEVFQTPMFRLMPVGFQKVIPSPGPTDAMVTAARVEKMLRSGEPSQFFCWVHLFDPHEPYEARGGTARNAEPRERWRSEVRHADAALGRILKALNEVGRDTDTIVIVNADHAEAFGEHAMWFHATSFFDTQIRVPLVVHVPGLPTGITNVPVGNVDLVPTILELLHLPVPDHVQGQSLLPLLLNPGISYPRAAFAESLNFSSSGVMGLDQVRVVTDGAWKLMHYVDDGFMRLFDVRTDPGETTNLISRFPEEAARLKGYLSALDRRLGRADPVEPASGMSSSLKQLIVQLHAASPAVRAATLLEIATHARHTMTAPLEREISRLDPETAHVLLAVLDASFMADVNAQPTAMDIPAEPGPVRFRMLERYSRLPRYQSLTVPTLTKPATPFAEYALSSARAARGSREDIAALRNVEPASRVLWHRLAPVLALGGDGPAAEQVAGGARGLHPGPRELVRIFRTLAQARSPSLSRVMTARWPSDQLQISGRFFAEMADLVCRDPLAEWLPGLIALHPGAPGSAQRKLDQAIRRLEPRLTSEHLDQIGREWTRGRRLERERRGGNQLREALGSLPEGVDLPSLAEELERSALMTTEPVGVPALRVTVSGVPGTIHDRAPGPPRVHIEAVGDARIPVGPWGVSSLRFVWTGPEEVGAALLGFDRHLVRPGRSLDLALPMDYPRRPGRYRLEVRWENRPLAPPAGTVSFEIPVTRSWRGPVIARVFQAPFPRVLPIRMLKNDAGVEFARGLGSSLTFPQLDLPAGPIKVALTFTAWTASPDPLFVSLRLNDEAPTPLGTATPGSRVTLEAEIVVPASGVKALTLIWPDRSSLVAIEQISLR